MSLAIVHSRAEAGMDAPKVAVETHLSPGLPRFSIVGLPEAAVKESRDRVRGAILNSNFEFPRKRIIVNLAPADLPKEGGRFDLPIAIGLLAASGQVRADDIADYVFLGELALSGALRDIRGPLVAALSLRGSGKKLVLPAKSAKQAAVVEGVEVQGAKSLLQICAALNRSEELPLLPPARARAAAGRGRHERRGRPAFRQARAGNRRGRRPQRADDRPARPPARPCSPTACPASCPT